MLSTLSAYCSLGQTTICLACSKQAIIFYKYRVSFADLYCLLTKSIRRIHCTVDSVQCTLFVHIRTLQVSVSASSTTIIILLKHSTHNERWYSFYFPFFLLFLFSGRLCGFIHKFRCAACCAAFHLYVVCMNRITLQPYTYRHTSHVFSGLIHFFSQLVICAPHHNLRQNSSKKVYSEILTGRIVFGCAFPINIFSPMKIGMDFLFVFLVLFLL